MQPIKSVIMIPSRSLKQDAFIGIAVIGVTADLIDKTMNTSVKLVCNEDKDRV